MHTQYCRGREKSRIDFFFFLLLLSLPSDIPFVSLLSVIYASRSSSMWYRGPEDRWSAVHKTHTPRRRRRSSGDWTRPDRDDDETCSSTRRDRVKPWPSDFASRSARACVCLCEGEKTTMKKTSHNFQIPGVYVFGRLSIILYVVRV